VLYDESQAELDWSREHRTTIIDGHGRATLEAQFNLSRGDTLRVFVVHLKSGGGAHDIRREQLRRLLPALREAAGSDDELVVLGDFNATGEADRTLLASIAEQLGLHWASESLPCTAYWKRDDGCRASALDHVLTRARPLHVTARGPCEIEGCSPGQRCPAFHREVSDHCPVTVDLP
jgi:endonuclease/exonuclease/phosphatase family metal-dependent hydrolase